METKKSRVGVGKGRRSTQIKGKLQIYIDKDTEISVRNYAEKEGVTISLAAESLIKTALSIPGRKSVK